MNKNTLNIRWALIMLGIFCFTNICIAKEISESMLQTMSATGERFEGDDSVVVTIKDSAGNLYVLKQTKENTSDSQLQIIVEYVVSQIALIEDINVPETQIIPATWQHPAKPFKNRIALLQPKVPGVCVNENVIQIKQSSRSPWQKDIMDKRFGPLSLANTGLTPSVISMLVKNKDLSKIAALDTFINNADRSSGNLIYDSDTDVYYAIDHLAAFTNKSLALHALRQISEHEKELTVEEIEALKIYLATLQGLYNNMPPKKTITSITENMIKFCPKYKQDAEIVDTLESYSRFIRNNYKDTKKLISYLEQL
ncbi:MAG: HipA family kinase [Rickettsiaceae bacterium]